MINRARRQRGGQVQGEVIHVVAQRLDDLSPLLASVGGRGDTSGMDPVARADVVKHGSGPDRRDPEERVLGRPARNMFDPDLALGSGIIPGQPTEGIKVRTRDFR
ncbi:hypothetical protein [Novosphingobium sp. SG707]|uniref:hypothetical protein n=1 Tax=Novosphingobium sp. SG707 TaxID=2586996 RepID=UPI00185E75C0|nr:hypothetical protein [Novosphingobium sp. SG707]